MKNLIYTCVFNNEKYLILLFWFLESIQLFGNLDENTDLLIYTSSSFVEIIKSHPLYNDKIVFFINDNYNSIDLALKARLDIFDYEGIDHYDKILYLDTDILILKDLNPIFELIEKNVIYACKEGNLIEDRHGYMYGGLALFTEEEIENYEDKSCFTSCTMLFNRCEEIKNLFSIIKQHIIYKGIQFGTGDQPYIVYNAKKYNLIDNIKITPFLTVNNMDIYIDYTINHFGGYAGYPNFKLESMPKFLNEFKEYKKQQQEQEEEKQEKQEEQEEQEQEEQEQEEQEEEQEKQEEKEEQEEQE
jgi:lipopolysaccharide biosynthesis glycosyltransferase